MFCPFDGALLIDAQATDEKLDPLLGVTIDARYAIEAVLGEGGMGTVYRTRHVTLGRALALKVLRSDLAQEPELAARFLVEAQATAAIEHPNVVSITDFGRLPDKRPYFVMELLTGQTLSALIRAGGPLPASAAVHVAIAIASGLEAAHAAGVVHRDLKPENVFLLDDASKEVRVVDFGAALIVGASRLTKKGVVFGTPYYMSPEQAAGKDVDHRADIYALGVMLYEMLTARVPFEGDTYMGVLTQHMFVLPKPPSEAFPDLCGKLGAVEAVLLRALEKDPAARFPTMHAFAEALVQSLDARLGPSWPSPERVSSAPKGIADSIELPTMGEILHSITASAVAARRRKLRTLTVVALTSLVAIVAIAAAVHAYSTPSVSASTSASASGPASVSTPASVSASVSTPASASASASANANANANADANANASVPTPQATTPLTKPPRPHPTSKPATVNALGPDPFEQR